MTRHKGLLSLIVGALLLSVAARAENTTPRNPTKPMLRVVFFTPSDVLPPKGVEERLRQIADYTQNFFGRWMKHWGYGPEQPLALDRDSEGIPEILYIRGIHTEASGKYRKPDFQSEVIQSACRQYGIQRQGQVWWIFMYKGPQQNWGRGGGDSLRGGAATARFYTEPGEIKVGTEMADGFHREIMLKGAIHEFGHALGLPHIGPKDSDKLGNSLMGPVNKVYSSRKGPGDHRVYLSQASAAMLWRHPLFTRSKTEQGRQPKASLTECHAKQRREEDHIEVSGKIQSSVPVHSVVVAEVGRNPRGDYWTQTFVGKVASDGTFRVHLNGLEKRDGCLKITFCCQNGAIVGESKGRGFTGGFSQLYSYQNGVFVFASKQQTGRE